MADLLVLKIKYDKTLRRITLPKLPELELSFASLDKKIRELFKLSQHATFVVTYTDNEGDIVTMADDDDMKDAVTFQSLNPLRLRVKLLGDTPASLPSVASEDQKPADVQKQVVPIVTPQESPSGSKVLMNLEKKQDALEEKLDAIFGVNVETLAASLQPSISIVSKALDEVTDASLEPDVAAPSEPRFSVAESQSKADAAESSSEKSIVPDVVDMQTEHISLPKEVADGLAATTTAATATEGETVVDRVHHTGFQCDLCGMMPIIGPRFKSTVKADYDLCASCYEQHGVAGEYNKIERALFRPRQFPFWTHGGRMGAHGSNFGPGPRVGLGGRPIHMGRGGGCGRSFERCPDGKLDSRFVKDVTIFDGTEFAPGTHFTKIWRLRNTGSIPWPQHTRLVHVGGDHLGAENFVAVPVPEEGLQPGEEVEASVDLLAPEKAGRYVSHWRLMAPGGRKFGHRVWALIQVVPRSETPLVVAESVADVMPVEENAGAVPTSSPPPEELSLEKSVFEPETSLAAVLTLSLSENDLRESTVDVNSHAEDAVDVDVEEVPVHTPVVVSEYVDVNSSVPMVTMPSEENTSVGGFSFVDYPVGAVAVGELTDASVTVQIPAEEFVPEYTDPTDVEVIVYGNHAGVEENDFVNVESGNVQLDEMLQQLEAMGFLDRELNAELLNQYDMDIARVLDELVAAADWDPMLLELEEMGFYDTKVNRRLMFKNKGSVKRVVKELVQMYRQQGQTRVYM